MEFGQICLNEKDRLAVIILAALLAHALDTLQKVVKIKVHVRIYYSVIFMSGTCQQFMKRLVVYQSQYQVYSIYQCQPVIEFRPGYQVGY
jgi:hypothetical protein